MSNSEVFDDALIAEKAWGTPLADFVRSIYTQESGGGKNTKTSNRGAVGGMQILPGTFNEVADKGWDINDQFDNLRAGIRYAKKMFDKAGGDPVIAAAGYYGGTGGLEKAKKGIAVSDPKNPNAPNTIEYGKQVADRMGQGGGTAVAQAPAAAPEQPVALTPMPPAVIASAESYGPSKGVSTGPSAWRAFLDSLPDVQAQVPLQLSDFNFGGVLPSIGAAKLTLPPSTLAQPHLKAFTGWKANLA